MLFSSPVFLFGFLPLLLAVYFLCGRRTRNVVLLAASLSFYAWGEVRLVAVMLASTAMNYGFGVWVDRERGRPLQKFVLTLAVTANLGILFYFKYATFLLETVNTLLAGLGAVPFRFHEITLPIGISFYTFQALSYVVDVYRQQAKVERNPINVALYIALFPQLIAGPIVRYTDIAEQIRQRATTLRGFSYGVERFVFGLGKKVLIANSVATVADAVFDIPDAQLASSVAWLGIVCYTLQIYFDFSGYSDMAVGLGHMFGFRFMENFQYPYTARSITDFWRRWHISLSTWFRDYLYIPLGGNRCSPARVAGNLLTVFLLCGLWHGANWTFVCWGAWHGIFLILERRGWGRALESIWAPLRHTYVLLIVMLGWVLFRAESFGHALAYCSALAGWSHAAGSEYHLGLYLDPGLVPALLAGLIGATPVVPVCREWLRRRESGGPEGTSGRLVLGGALGLGRTAAIASVLVASVAMMLAGTHNPFLYFRF